MSVAVSTADLFADIDLNGHRALVVGVSGGSDSLALLFLLHDHLRQFSNAPDFPDFPDLIAVTIDHGLRPESAREATVVAKLCADHGITHRIMRWEGEKPQTGIPAAARAARYRLLVQAARESGASYIFTGHTRNDQIETFLMRAARSNISERTRGLAGMARMTLLERDFSLVRPLLHISRNTLRMGLMARQIAWVDDPTNEDTTYERPRLRHHPIDARNEQMVLADIEVATLLRQTQNAEVVRVLHDMPDLLVIRAGEVAEIDASLLAMGKDAAMLLIGVVIALLGGKPFLPGTKQRTQIQAYLDVDEDAKVTARISLCGCVIERGQGAHRRHRIWREQRNLPDIHVKPQQSAIWDGRYLVHNHGSSALRVAAADNAAVKGFCKNHGLDLTGLHYPARRAMPVILVNDAIIAIPALADQQSSDERIAVERYFSLFDQVLPGHDIELAKAVKGLFMGINISKAYKTCKPV